MDMRINKSRHYKPVRNKFFLINIFNSALTYAYSSSEYLSVMYVHYFTFHFHFISGLGFNSCVYNSLFVSAAGAQRLNGAGAQRRRGTTANMLFASRNFLLFSLPPYIALHISSFCLSSPSSFRLFISSSLYLPFFSSPLPYSYSPFLLISSSPLQFVSMVHGTTAQRYRGTGVIFLLWSLQNISRYSHKCH